MTTDQEDDEMANDDRFTICEVISNICGWAVLGLCLVALLKFIA